MDKNIKKVGLNLGINIKQMRLALVGDGYLLQEVENINDTEIITIWEKRLGKIIRDGYCKGVRLGLYEKIGE